MNALFAQNKSPLIIGHRGCRGIMPENTIEAFNTSIKVGSDGIEWDVVVNKDRQLVISHEPFMDARYCLMPDGSEIHHQKKTKHLRNVSKRD